MPGESGGGPHMIEACQVVHGNSVIGNHPGMQPHWAPSHRQWNKQYLPNPILTKTRSPGEHVVGCGGARIRNDSVQHKINDPQRSRTKLQAKYIVQQEPALPGSVDRPTDHVVPQAQPLTA